jgi:hypothetical protein
MTILLPPRSNHNCISLACSSSLLMSLTPIPSLAMARSVSLSLFPSDGSSFPVLRSPFCPFQSSQSPSQRSGEWISPLSLSSHRIYNPSSPNISHRSLPAISLPQLTILCPQYTAPSGAYPIDLTKFFCPECSSSESKAHDTTARISSKTQKMAEHSSLPGMEAGSQRNFLLSLLRR